MLRKDRMAKNEKTNSQFDNMALEELLDLREQMDKLIERRLASEKLMLTQRLARIERFERRKRHDESPPPGHLRRPVSPKYRDPYSGKLWSGRGKLPRWMTALIAQGAKKEDFRIGD
jgi:DNA-binding protein H-NS